MWALRRASGLKGARNHLVLASRASCARSDLSSGKWKLVDGDYRRDLLCMARDCVSADAFFCGSSFHATPFLGIRNLSSQANSNNKDDDDGFSDLDEPSESKRVGEIADGEGDEALLSEGELTGDGSEVDPAEGADESDGLTEAETDSNGEDRSQKKNIVSPLFQLIVKSSRNSVTKALDKWVEEGNPLGRSEFTIAMLNLRKRGFYGKALQLSEWLEANKRLNFVERDYASHLDLVAKVQGLQKAESYIERVPKSFQGEVLYRTLLASCVSSRNVKKAEEVFKKIKELGLPITIFSCNQLVLLYKRVDRKKIADVLLRMEKENVKPSLYTYMLLIDTKGRLKDISGMEQVLEAMKSDGMEPDTLTQAIVAEHYVYGGLKEKAEAVLKDMEGNDIKKNRDACRYLLPLYAALGKIDEVKRVWKVCEESPRLYECLAAIEAWGKLGCINEAEELFENTLKSWKKLSSKFYRALMKIYANHKLLSKGKDLAKRMSESGFHIGPLTLDALVRLYVESGEVEKADSILEKAAQKNWTNPLYASYMIILEHYSKRADIHNAEKIFQKLRQSGFTVRIGQYQLLLQAYIDSKTPAYGFKERMKADGIYPNKHVADQLTAVDAFRKGQICELLD